ncbi:MAG: hydantoinase/oxoprolinase family protein [Bryobacteraceae bacterium]
MTQAGGRLEVTMRIGVDAGGTFTDFVVLHKDGRIESFKLRSNPRSPASVILAGLERAAAGAAADVVHGSTVATNALLERKGARTAFVTTEGFEDLIHIGRQNRAQLYNLTPPERRYLVPRELCFGVGERSLFDGRIERAPSAGELKALRHKLRKAGVQSVAICFLHSYQNPSNERIAAQALGQEVFLCASHEICPEFREYERSSTTILNAYVGPLMAAYLGELERGSPSPISILQSNGGFMTAAEASRHAVRTILSGPAGGIVGAVEMAKVSGFSRILGFDMGGTSTDVSLAEGAPRETAEAYVDGMPVRVPMLDIHTVGAGGGSIARVDEGGLLRVGPESAGADPGPACYGAGDQPTVTDAHVILGRIVEEQFLGGGMRIYRERAEAAVDRIAGALGLDRIAAAAGIVRVANANMERAIRVVTVERGYDPREFALVAFGGCGALHACEIAEALGIHSVIVPRHAEALSALGMLLADRVRDYAAGALGANVAERFAALERTARAEMPRARLERHADLRYAGQSYELTVPWNPRDPAALFHAAHQRTYGYHDEARAVEVVTIRVRARIRVKRPELKGGTARAEGRDRPSERRIHVDGRWRKALAYTREQVPARATPGPALVLDYGATTLVPSNWRFRREPATGNLILTSR